MSYFLLSLNYTLMLAIPIIVATLIRRKTGASWRLFFIGGVTFVLSQVAHIPFNWLVQQSEIWPSDLSSWSNLLAVAVFLGLSAGVFEETARYLTYRFWARDARSWSRGLMLGAGHGGTESILLGVLAGVGFAGLVLTATNETLLSAVPADQRTLISDSLAEVMAMPWYGLLLGAVERLFALAAHLALSLLVLQVFLRRSGVWLFVAISFHALFNAAAVVGAARLGAYATEGILALFGLFSLFIIIRLRGPEPVTALAEAELPAIAPIEMVPLRPTAEALERSRYSD